MCKKGCYRASIASENNKEYKNVCINSPNNQQNIYSFCEEKFTTFNPNLINFCKLDMCNLCCVGMDTIKNKNYSVPNLKSCFKDCAKNYNIVALDKEVPTSKIGDVPGPEECNSVPNIDIKDLNKEEKFDSSFMMDVAKNKAKNNPAGGAGGSPAGGAGGSPAGGDSGSPAGGAGGSPAGGAGGSPAGGAGDKPAGGSPAGGAGGSPAGGKPAGGAGAKDDKDFNLDKFRADLLKKTNELRKNHQADELKVNKDLEAVAQKYAEKLAAEKSFAHSHAKFKGDNMGENLFMQMGRKMVGEMPAESWYSEIKDYNFEDPKKKTGVVGHFTQLVWKGSKEVGHGCAKASDGSYYVVGNYYPAGNWMGEEKKNVFPKK